MDVNHIVQVCLYRRRLLCCTCGARRTGLVAFFRHTRVCLFLFNSLPSRRLSFRVIKCLPLVGGSDHLLFWNEEMKKKRKKLTPPPPRMPTSSLFHFMFWHFHVNNTHPQMLKLLLWEDKAPALWSPFRVQVRFTKFIPSVSAVHFFQLGWFWYLAEQRGGPEFPNPVWEKWFWTVNI